MSAGPQHAAAGECRWIGADRSDRIRRVRLGRRPAVIGIIATLLPGTSGCGLFGDEPAQGPGPPGDDGPSPQKKPAGRIAPTDPRAARIDWRQAEGETINLVYVQSALMEQVLAAAPEFERLTGIEVQADGLSEGAMLDALSLDFISGAGEYDVVQVAPYEVPKYVQRGWVRNLRDFIDAPELTDAEWYDYGDFLDAPAGSLRIGDYIAGVPLDSFPGVLHYRKDLFEKHDIDVPDTLAELERAAAKLNRLDTDGDGQPDVWGIGLRGQPYQFALQSFVRSAGGRYLSEDGDLRLTSPETIAGMASYARLVRNYAPPGYASITWAELLEDFKAGRLAMTVDALVWTRSYEDPATSSVAGKVGVAPMPGRSEKRPGEPGMWTWGLGVSANSAEPEASWLFVQWATSKARSLELSKERHATSRTSVTRNPAWQRIVGEIQNGEWARRYTTDMRRADSDYHVTEVGGEAFETAAELQEIVGIQAQAAMSGEKSVREAMADAEAYLKRRME